MMLLHSKLAPALMTGSESTSDLQGILEFAANAAFPNDSLYQNALCSQHASHCHNASPALSERMVKFFVDRGVSGIPVSKDDGIVRIYNVCCYFISELLELANNNRLHCGHSKLVPQHLRQAVLWDEQLLEACNGKQVCELYYPFHME